MVRTCIRMLRIPFEGLEFAFERFESHSNVSNLYSNASNPVRMVRICIRTLRIPFLGLEIAFERFESFEFTFECFVSHSNGSNLHLNTSNSFRMYRICFQLVGIPFEWFKFHSNSSNPVRMIRICFQMLLIPFEWFKFEFEFF